MRCDRLGKAGQVMCFLTGCFDGIFRDRLVGVTAWEQPALRVDNLPIAAEDIQQLGREHHIPVFAAFALLDADDHPLAINGDGLQANSFRNAQTCRVANGQDHSMSAAVHAPKEVRDLLGAQDDG